MKEESASSSLKNKSPIRKDGYNQIKQTESSDDTSHITPSKIDIDKQLYPYCIVWTPIPGITTLIPSIGHTGFCTSTGVIHDFAGSHYVSVNDMAFGSPYKYIQLYPNDKEKEQWDKAVANGDKQYNRQEHNLITNNCHSHCAYILNQLNYNNKSNYTMITIWWLLITKGKYISWSHVIKTYIGFIILSLFVLLIVYSIKSNHR